MQWKYYIINKTILDIIKLISNRVKIQQQPNALNLCDKCNCAKCVKIICKPQGKKWNANDNNAKQRKANQTHLKF